jgi:hypothetical protein
MSATILHLRMGRVVMIWRNLSMPRPLLIGLIAFFASANLYGQEAKKPSPAVTRILDEAVRAVKKNRVDFDKANQKPLGDARKALEELSTKLIKDGKADEAGAVLKQVGTLEADVMRMANAPAPVPAPVPAEPQIDRQIQAVLCGPKWRHGKHPNRYLFFPDGSYVLEGTRRTGTYEVVGRDKKCVLLRWNGESLIEVIRVGDRPDNWTMSGEPFVPAEAKPR